MGAEALPKFTTFEKVIYFYKFYQRFGKYIFNRKRSLLNESKRIYNEGDTRLSSLRSKTNFPTTFVICPNFKQTKT